MEIRVLDERDIEAFHAIRMEGLADAPYAFGSSLEEERDRPIEQLVERLRPEPDGNFAMGAFDGERLVSVAGFRRSTNIKERHKGYIWGVYVTPSHRGQGIARRLMETLLARARGYAGLELITLSVSVTQPAARRLYDNLGFEVFGLEPHALKIGDAYIDEEHRMLRL